MANNKPNPSAWLWFVLLGTCIYFLGYLTERTQHIALIGLLLVAFIACWKSYRSEIPVLYLLAGAIGLRFMLLVMWPNLSEDIYRYIWDGQLLLHGEDPFQQVPASFAETSSWPAGTSAELYEKLNSKEYYAVYPPLAQYLFLGVAYISGSSIFAQVIAFRILVLVAEIATCLLLWKLLRKYGFDERNVLLYALNPVVILELTGNLHLEAFMLLFVILLLHVMEWKKSGVLTGMAHAASIATKLVPVIFAPVLLFRMKWRTGIVYLFVTIVTLSLFFFPLLAPSLTSGMGESIALYFKKFEFNASYYYILRSIGYWRKGYNLIGDIGPALAVLSIICITAYSWVVRKENNAKLPVHFGMILTIYLAFSTTVHPWYVVPLVGILCLSNYKYGFVWSFTAMWSYIGYKETGYVNPSIAIFLEYLIVYVLMLYEIRKNSFLPSA